jgi:hypothetical protein
LFPSADISADSLDVITGEFSDILVRLCRSFSATTNEGSILGCVALHSDNMSGRASAFVMEKCQKDGRLLF